MNRHGSTASAIHELCAGGPVEHADVLTALQELCGKLSGQSIGGVFGKFQRRNFGGWVLDKAGEDLKKSARWTVRPVAPPTSAD